MYCWRKMMLFSIGGAAYMGLELLWRGWTHGTMFLAGGSAFLLLGSLTKLPLPMRLPAGAAVITGVELVSGLLFNGNHSVWDYSALPLNLDGQICLLYSLLWMGLTLPACSLYQLLDRSIQKSL